VERAGGAVWRVMAVGGTRMAWRPKGRRAGVGIAEGTIIRMPGVVHGRGAPVRISRSDPKQR
jgi:hypothetical protein